VARPRVAELTREQISEAEIEQLWTEPAFLRKIKREFESDPEFINDISKLLSNQANRGNNSLRANRDHGSWPLLARGKDSFDFVCSRGSNRRSLLALSGNMTRQPD
jgi:hypothetical protein